MLQSEGTPCPGKPWKFCRRDCQLSVDIASLPSFDRPLDVTGARMCPCRPGLPGRARLASSPSRSRPRAGGFPCPLSKRNRSSRTRASRLPNRNRRKTRPGTAQVRSTRTHIKPPSDLVIFKDRLLYLLQPPLEDLFVGRQVQLPFQPYPYQVKGIAFLMPRHAALLADEMGLGKTAQVLIALRLLLHGGLIRRALIVCPKSLVVNWTRELHLWAEDVPFEVIGGDTQTRRAQWFASNCPVKLVNYELLTRDADLFAESGMGEAKEESRKRVCISTSSSSTRPSASRTANRRRPRSCAAFRAIAAGP